MNPYAAKPAVLEPSASRLGIGVRLGWGDRLLGLGLLATLLLFAGASWQRHAAQNAESAQRARLADAQARRAALQQDATTAAALSPLRDEGFLAPENRADWLRRLHAERAELGLPSLGYRIAAPRPWHPPDAPNAAHLRASRMTLSLGLDHEAELEAFLTGLLRPAPGARPLLHACRLEVNPARPQPPDAPPTPGANLLAECQIDWIGADPPAPGS